MTYYYLLETSGKKLKPKIAASRLGFSWVHMQAGAKGSPHWPLFRLPQDATGRHLMRTQESRLATSAT